MKTVASELEGLDLRQVRAWAIRLRLVKVVKQLHVRHVVQSPFKLILTDFHKGLLRSLAYLNGNTRIYRQGLKDPCSTWRRAGPALQEMN